MSWVGKDPTPSLSWLSFPSSHLLVRAVPDKAGIHCPNPDILFFGPDENTANLMEVGPRLPFFSVIPPCSSAPYVQAPGGGVCLVAHCDPTHAVSSRTKHTQPCSATGVWLLGEDQTRSYLMPRKHSPYSSTSPCLKEAWPQPPTPAPEVISCGRVSPPATVGWLNNTPF